MRLLIVLSAAALLQVTQPAAGSQQDTSQPEKKRQGRDGWGPGGWETRNGVSSFGWDSQRPLNCPRCPQPGEYRGNGYDNLSPEWNQREHGKNWPQEGGGGGSTDNYGDKRVWSGTIRPIEDQPGGLVTNWIGGSSRWRDPWDQRDVRYWHSSRGGYAGGYGYSQGSSYGYSQRDGGKPYYDRSRGESGYISRYPAAHQPWDQYYGGVGYARGWDYYEQRPGSTSGGGYTYRGSPYREQSGGDFRNDWYNRPSYDYSRPSQDYGGREEGAAGWNTYNRAPGGYGSSGGYDYGRPPVSVTRPSPESYGKPVAENRPWYEPGRPNPDYGRPVSRPSDYGRPTPEYTRPDYGRPDHGRPNTDYVRPKPDYTRPGSDYGRPGSDHERPSIDYGRPNTDYGRPSTDYGRPSIDYGRPEVESGRPDYGRPIITKPSPGDYGPNTDYNAPPLPTSDYGRPAYQPEYSRPTTDYGRPAPEYNRPTVDYGRPPVDHGRLPTDYGRPPPDYGRPPPDYGSQGPDFSRPDYGHTPADYGRPGCSTCRPDPDRPVSEHPAGYPGGGGSYNGYKPPRVGDGYAGDRGYPAVSGGGYGGGRPEEPGRDEGGKSPLDRYPGHTGVGATFEFDSDRKQDHKEQCSGLMAELLQSAISYSNEKSDKKT